MLITLSIIFTVVIGLGVLIGATAICLLVGAPIIILCFGDIIIFALIVAAIVKRILKKK